MTADSGSVVLWLEDEDLPRVRERLENGLAGLEDEFELGQLVEVAQYRNAVQWVGDNPGRVKLYIIDLYWEGQPVDGTDMMSELLALQEAPVIFLTERISEFASQLSDLRDDEFQAFTYVRKAWEEGELEFAVRDVMRKFALSDVTVRRAVSALRRYGDWGEELAYHNLQKLSSSQRKNMKDVAQEIMDLVREVENTDAYGELMEFLKPVK